MFAIFAYRSRIERKSVNTNNSQLRALIRKRYCGACCPLDLRHITNPFGPDTFHASKENNILLPPKWVHWDFRFKTVYRAFHNYRYSSLSRQKNDSGNNDGRQQDILTSSLKNCGGLISSQFHPVLTLSEVKGRKFTRNAPAGLEPKPFTWKLSDSPWTTTSPFYIIVLWKTKIL